MRSVLLLLPLWLFSSCAAILSMNLYPQEESVWCWAACGQTCMHKACSRTAPTQCRQATDCARDATKRQVDCCASAGIDCRKEGFPLFSRYGYHVDSSDNPLSWSAIMNEIQKGRPLTYIEDNGDGTTHMLVIYGYADTMANSPKSLVVFNPLPVNLGSSYFLSYSDYASPRKHERTYFGISKKGIRCYIGRHIDISAR